MAPRAPDLGRQLHLLLSCRPPKPGGRALSAARRGCRRPHAPTAAARLGSANRSSLLDPSQVQAMGPSCALYRRRRSLWRSSCTPAPAKRGGLGASWLRGSAATISPAHNRARRPMSVEPASRRPSDRKIEAVPQFHRLLRAVALVLAAAVALPVIRGDDVSRCATERPDRLRQLLASAGERRPINRARYREDRVPLLARRRNVPDQRIEVVEARQIDPRQAPFPSKGVLGPPLRRYAAGGGSPAANLSDHRLSDRECRPEHRRRPSGKPGSGQRSGSPPALSKQTRSGLRHRRSGGNRPCECGRRSWRRRYRHSASGERGKLRRGPDPTSGSSCPGNRLAAASHSRRCPAGYDKRARLAPGPPLPPRARLPAMPASPVRGRRRPGEPQALR